MLIFSQMVRMLDILAEYLKYRQFPFQVSISLSLSFIMFFSLFCRITFEIILHINYIFLKYIYLENYICHCFLSKSFNFSLILILILSSMLYIVKKLD